MIANSPLNSMGNYTAPAYDCVPLTYIGDSPNDLHTDLNFQNQAIQCCLFEPREAEYGKVNGRERAASVYVTMHC